MRRAELACLAFESAETDYRHPSLDLLQGAEIKFGLKGGEGSSLPAGASLSVFTTRPDTLFGVWPC